MTYLPKAIIIYVTTFLFYCESSAQFQAPYKIVNRDTSENLDSLWVLFPDIQASKKAIIVPATPIISPYSFKVGDWIMLDSQYQLDIIIQKIAWVDSINCVVMCKMPTRQNTTLTLRYRTFGKKWVFEGTTGHDPVSCDHLTVNMWDENHISFGYSMSRNCN